MTGSPSGGGDGEPGPMAPGGSASRWSQIPGAFKLGSSHPSVCFCKCGVGPSVSGDAPCRPGCAKRQAPASSAWGHGAAETRAAASYAPADRQTCMTGPSGPAQGGHAPLVWASVPQPFAASTAARKGLDNSPYIGVGANDPGPRRAHEASAVTWTRCARYRDRPRATSCTLRTPPRRRDDHDQRRARCGRRPTTRRQGAMSRTPTAHTLRHRSRSTSLAPYTVRHGSRSTTVAANNSRHHRAARIRRPRPTTRIRPLPLHAPHRHRHNPRSHLASPDTTHLSPRVAVTSTNNRKRNVPRTVPAPHSRGPHASCTARGNETHPRPRSAHLRPPHNLQRTVPASVALRNSSRPA